MKLKYILIALGLGSATGGIFLDVLGFSAGASAGAAAGVTAGIMFCANSWRE
jgi:hypothetical protein